MKKSNCIITFFLLATFSTIALVGCNSAKQDTASIQESTAPPVTMKPTSIPVPTPVPTVTPEVLSAIPPTVTQKY